MSKCPNCQVAVSPNAKFCQNCGHQAVALREPRRRLSSGSEGSGAAEHAALWAETLNKAKARTRKAFIFFGVSCFLLVLYWMQDPDPSPFNYFMVFYAALALTGVLRGRARWLTRAEYYSLSDSRDESGEHRCVFCGHRGIHTQGEYASNVKYSRCSACQEPLFSMKQ